jgi:hypothetical protein
MKRLGIAATLLLTLGTGVMKGQTADPQCNALGTADACQKAIDFMKYLSPQIGAAIAGGNTILGSGGVLGGLPHWTVGVRANIVAGAFPNFTTANAPNPSVSTPAKSSYTTSTTPLPFVAVDGAIGVFGGVPLGLTKVGGVDLLGTVAYVPTVSPSGINVAPATNTKFGGGLRVGLLQESLLVPGVSVSFIQRGLPKTTITSVVGSGNPIDTLQLKDLDLSTSSFRATISKSLILFGVAAGVGVDKYKQSTGIYVAHHQLTPLPVNVSGTFKTDANVTRTNVFGDLYMNILLLKIVGEVGVVSGGDVTTFNTYDKSPTASKPYGAIGLRVGF